MSDQIDLKKIPGAVLKIVIFTFLGFITGTLSGYVIFWIITKLSLLHSTYWLIYFLPAGAVSGTVGGIILGTTEAIKTIIIESGLLETTTRKTLELIFAGMSGVTDPEKHVGTMFNAADRQIRKLKLKAEEIRNGRGFFLTRFLKSRSYALMANILAKALESPEVRKEPITNRERFIKVFHKAVNFYTEEVIDELLSTPFIIWILVNLLVIAIPIIIGLIS